MVTVLIIGIFSALAIPGIIEIRYRNTLTDSVERVRSAAQMARDLAMKTRNAAVLEVRGDKMWINLLTGPSCLATIDKRCTSQVANRAGVAPLYEADGLGASAGIALCGGVVRSLSAPTEENPNQTCSASATLSVATNTGFGLCYSGSGELRYRVGVDANTVCDATDDHQTAAVVWLRSCSLDPEQGVSVAVALPDGATASLTDGAVLQLNRYDSAGTSCNADDAIDTTRLVKIPINGAPYSELP
jgi:type II secretory pathway pseudopilin PulG